MSLVLKSLEDGILTLTIHRPEAPQRAQPQRH